MKKVYILAYSKTNLGDDIFIDMLVKRYPNILFFSKNMKLDSKTYKENENLYFIDYNLDELIEFGDFDAFVYIGGSIFMEHAGGVERIEKLHKLAIKCKNQGVPFYYISSNFGPYQTELYKTSVTELFKDVTDVCLRDKASYDLFSDIKTIRYAPDAVLSYNFRKCEKEKDTIGISVINFKFREPLRDYEKSYYSLLINSIKSFLKQGYKIKLFSFCLYEGDEDTANYIVEHLPKKSDIEIVSYTGNIKDFIKKYSKVEYMICSRFHSVILSYLLKQKMYVLSYSDKINNVIDDLNLIDKYVNVTDTKKIKTISIEDFTVPNYSTAVIKESENQFKELDKLLSKHTIEDRVSVVIPARNEEKNIQKVIKLLKKNPFVNQIIVVDNASIDNTAELARTAGAQVYSCPNPGKGYALEEGFKHVVNEVVLFIDADISNYSKDLVYKLTEPILVGRADFVKSMFDRKGGRVTELVAKPLLEILFPQMHEFSQPLSGMFAGKRDLLAKLTFEKDYGVDIGILLDMIHQNATIEEVHIGTIKNVSQPWKSLEKMSKEVVQAIIKRANY